MNREIKFRAWTKWNKKMRYDISRIDFGVGEEFNGNPIQVDFEEPNHKQGMATGIVLMQYTGLKDKNGKEIYEGDIVKHENGSVSVVEWSQGDWCWFMRQVKNWSPKTYFDSSKDEIIGNIHENPDLLTKDM